MSFIPPLSPDRLYRACDTGHFTFTTTAELDDLAEGIGQMRAIDAAHFGIGMRHAGYNLYAMGPPGTLNASAAQTQSRIGLTGSFAT